MTSGHVVTFPVPALVTASAMATASPYVAVFTTISACRTALVNRHGRSDLRRGAVPFSPSLIMPFLRRDTSRKSRHNTFHNKQFPCRASMKHVQHTLTVYGLICNNVCRRVRRPRGPPGRLLRLGRSHGKSFRTFTATFRLRPAPHWAPRVISAVYNVECTATWFLCGTAALGA